MPFKLTVGLLAFVAYVPAALAYIGPGAGIGLVGSLLGVLATILLAVIAIIAWPLRTYLKRRRARREKSSAPQSDTDGAT